MFVKPLQLTYIIALRSDPPQRRSNFLPFYSISIQIELIPAYTNILNDLLTSINMKPSPHSFYSLNIPSPWTVPLHILSRSFHIYSLKFATVKVFIH